MRFLSPNKRTMACHRPKHLKSAIYRATHAARGIFATHAKRVLLVCRCGRVNASHNFRPTCFHSVPESLLYTLIYSFSILTIILLFFTIFFLLCLASLKW